MIEYIRGDIFSTDCEAIVCPVNTVGVMGKGLALEFKRRYAPDMFYAYRQLCFNGTLKLGCPAIYTKYNPAIIFCPTKDNWRNDSSIWSIETGLESDVMHKALTLYHSIAFPKLGCGCGNLSWDEVKHSMESHLSNTSNRIVIYV